MRQQQGVHDPVGRLRPSRKRADGARPSAKAALHSQQSNSIQRLANCSSPQFAVLRQSRSAVPGRSPADCGRAPSLPGRRVPTTSPCPRAAASTSAYCALVLVPRGARGVGFALLLCVSSRCLLGPEGVTTAFPSALRRCLSVLARLLSAPRRLEFLRFHCALAE